MPTSSDIIASGDPPTFFIFELNEVIKSRRDQISIQRKK